jgi:hypothetical protein
MATEFVTADPGSGGSNFAMDTETVGTVSVVHPISKIEWGPEDAFTLVNTGTASLPMQGAAAENAAVAGNPVLVAGRYDSSARTLGNGDAGAVALDASGQILVSGTLTVGNTVTVASHAVTNAGTFAVQPAPAASGGLTISRQIDVDETEDEISSSACQLYFISAQTIDATPLYLHFYNATAASVTVGTTTPLMTFIVPAQSDGNAAGLIVEVSMGIPFSTALSIAATTTVGGTTGPGANECIVTVGYKA